MVEVDVQTELTQINIQLEQLIGDYNKKDTELKQLMQQIQNISGIAMYLRGKIENNTQDEINLNNIGHDEIPDVSKIMNDV